MIYTSEVENMCCVLKGADHGPAPIPEEGKWVQAKEIKDISDHGVTMENFQVLSMIDEMASRSGQLEQTDNVQEDLSPDMTDNMSDAEFATL